MSKFKVLSFLFTNFGPLIIFYGVNHFFGLVPALISSIIWTLGEIIYVKKKGQKLTTFFKFTAALTIVFGFIDIYLQNSVFFRFEAAVSNLLIGCMFLASLRGEKTVIQEFAEKQGRIGTEISPDTTYVLRTLTIIWAVYSFLKAIFYSWVALNHSLEQGLMIRIIVGKVTFYLLLAFSIFGARHLKKLLGQMKLLPSTR